jgi:rhomboid protease GluP
MRILPKLTPTIFLVAANIGVYVFTSVVGGDFIQTSNIALLQYGQFNLSVWEGQYWQLLTSMFVHVDIIHLALNMLFLLIFGFRAEEFFTTEEYFSIYILAGLSGNFLTLIMMPLYTLSAGASGAIFGLYGAGIMYMRKAFGQSIAGALIYSFLLLLLTTGTGVNIVAHFGGLAAGLIIGYTLAKIRNEVVWVEENY